MEKRVPRIVGGIISGCLDRMVMKQELPPFISTGDPGSFAERTLKKRLPEQIDLVIARNRLSGRTARDLLGLKQELESGIIDDPFVGFTSQKKALCDEERSVWAREVSRYERRPWNGVPWYFAEALFYLKLLLACRYFDENGDFFRVDPFRHEKEDELFSDTGCIRTMAAVSELLEVVADPKEKLLQLIVCALWGNRIDLSNKHIAHDAGRRILDYDRERILVDHSGRLRELLSNAGRVDIVTDNCGTELGCDLLLAGCVLGFSARSRVYFHLKKHPMFVSDAMEKDVEKTVSAFVCNGSPALEEIGESLYRYMDEDRLKLRGHGFWNSPLHYTDLPKDLAGTLAESDVVIFKGDVNYRRLLSDRHWPKNSSMEDIAGYFPAPFAALRTLKSEIVVDIKEETAAELDSIDPDWMVNGERGIIRTVVKQPRS
ncbi:MAG: protein-glutamate O-methyltransferase family protein [Spirochaetes bacterium]|nr:protein-glutamate O-methyltransferase family protein [Spirochaetota bacterium]